MLVTKAIMLIDIYLFPLKRPISYQSFHLDLNKSLHSVTTRSKKDNKKNRNKKNSV